MVPQLAAILQDCPLFSRLDERRFARLFAISRLVRFRKGQLIFRQGEACPGIYIVGSGLVRIFQRGPQGREQVLHIVGPGGTFAEVAVIGGFDCPANAEAVTAAVCGLVPREPFRDWIHEDHQLSPALLMGLTVWTRHLVGLVEDVTLRDAAGRLARWLLAAAPEDDIVRLPSLKKHLASQLNITGETLSRTLKRLEKAGIIAAAERGEIRILDRPKLAAEAAGEGKAPAPPTLIDNPPPRKTRR
ncbi:MAG: Crp/Fnr family transcriptional regulator [Thermogutta sp.]|nr:Crp/Fnr family transcriptional regulator [Thermogutta sp.]